MNRFRHKYQRLLLPSVLVSTCLHLMAALVPGSFGEYVFGVSQNPRNLTNRMEIVPLAPESAPRYVQSAPEVPLSVPAEVVAPPPQLPLPDALAGDSGIFPTAPGLDFYPPPETALHLEPVLPLSSWAADSALALESYLNAVFKRLAGARRYPEAARRMGSQGEITLAFGIARDGSLEGSVELTSPCRYDILNRSAVDCVLRSAPFPPLPGHVLDERLTVTVRISFSLEP